VYNFLVLSCFVPSVEFSSMPVKVLQSPTRKRGREEHSQPSTSADLPVSPPSQSSETIILAAPRVPRNVIRAMKRAGAAHTFSEGVTWVCMHAGDEASCRYEAHLNELSQVEPHLWAVFTPSPADVFNFATLSEAQSILMHVAPLRMSDFQAAAPNRPALGGPLPAPIVGGVRFHSAASSGARVHSYMQNPGPTYPAIHALPRGGYVCTIVASWVGTIADTIVLRA
jgi:hypothetical protein